MHSTSVTRSSETTAGVRAAAAGVWYSGWDAPDFPPNPHRGLPVMGLSR